MIDNKDVLFTMDALGAIEVGDEVQLYINDDIPFVGRYGMDLNDDGRWAKITDRTTRNHPDGLDEKGVPRCSYSYYGEHYVFTILNIKGWRRP